MAPSSSSLLLLLLLYFPLVSCQSTLRFGTVEMQPFVMLRIDCMLDQNQNGCNATNSFKGYCVQLIALLAREMETEYSMEIKRNVGTLYPNGTYDGLIGDVKDGNIDVAVAPITVTTERSEAVDLTPFLSTGTSVMIRKREAPEVLNPFTNTTWLAIVVLVISSSCTCVVLYSKSKTAKKQGKGQFRFAIWIVFLLTLLGCTLALVAFAFQHYSSASKWNARVQSVPYIESLEELVEQDVVKYGMNRGGHTHHFFRNSNNTMHRKMLERMERNANDSFFSSYADGIERVRMSQTPYDIMIDHSENSSFDGADRVQPDGPFAFILDDSVNVYENAQLPCDTRKIGEKLNRSLLMSHDYAIATAKGSPLRERVRTAVDALKRSGEIDKLYERWFVERSRCQYGGEEPRYIYEVFGILWGEQYGSEANDRAVYVICAMIAAIVVACIASLIARRMENKRDNRSAANAEEVKPMTD